jgi:flagellar FliL protein
MLRLRSRAGKALPIILAVSVLIAGGAGAGVGIFLGNKGSATAEADSDHGHKKKKKKKHDEPPAIVFSLGEMVVNLADADTLRYAKLTVALGFEEKVSEEKLKEETPVLRDVVIGVVTQKKFGELHRPGGLEKLKEEIQAATEESLHEMTVSKVYFEGLAMQ